MTENKKMVEKYMDGFNKSDHKQILSCLEYFILPEKMILTKK